MEEPAGESGMDMRKALVRQIWFVSKTIKWLMPIDEHSERHGEKNINVLLYFTHST